VLFVPYERWTRTRPIKRVFLVLMVAVAFFGSTAWWEAAGEPDPGDLVSMLDHAAIVETMALACEDSRPDLAAAFKEAQQRWWARNAQIHQTVASLEREIGTPRAKAFLDYFNSLQRSLQQQIQDQRHAGDAEYAARCDGVPEELTRGRLDYRRSGAANGRGNPTSSRFFDPSRIQNGVPYDDARWQLPASRGCCHSHYGAKAAGQGDAFIMAIDWRMSAVLCRTPVLTEEV